jgi:DNA-directed RNA polymerase specialized sigma24 family protein
VIADLAAGREPDAAALAIVMFHLRLLVRRLFPDLDADDIVQATVARLLAKSGQLTASEIRSPWGYLVGATRNGAIDAIRARKRRREVHLDALPDEVASENAVASLIERDATHAAVVAALRVHIQAND